jgi:hypothetical protein
LVETLRATAAVFAFTFVTLAVCYGLGRLLQRAWRTRPRPDAEVDTTAWIGWGAAVAVIQLWHLFLPPDWWLASLLGVAGLAGLATARVDLRRFTKVLWRDHRWFLLALALAALWLANTSLGPPRNGDSGLYHFQAVRWAAAFPDVPGLANLHGRFGFTSSYTLYLALPDALFGVGRGSHLANAALLLLPIGRGLWALRTVAGGRSEWQASALFDLLFLFPFAERVWAEQVLTSATPDLPVFVLGFVLTSLLLRTFGRSTDRATDNLRVTAVIWLAAVGVTVKLSFVGFGLAAIALALLLRVRRARPVSTRRELARRLVPLGACCTVIVLPWMARSVVLSGYPLYPFPGLSVAVDWRVPHMTAVDDYNWVRSWARQPGVDWHNVLGSWSWFPSWARDLATSRYTLLTVCLPLALALAALLAVAFLRREYQARQPGALMALIPAVVSLVYWFATAPSPRLAGSAFWALGLAAVAVFLAAAVPSGSAHSWRALLLVALAILGAAVLFKLHQRGLLPVVAGPDAGFHPAPTVATMTVRTPFGVEVHVPIGTENCWNAPIPCTPNLRPALRLRRDADLRCGFTVNPPVAPPES